MSTSKAVILFDKYHSRIRARYGSYVGQSCGGVYILKVIKTGEIIGTGSSHEAAYEDAARRMGIDNDAIVEVHTCPGCSQPVPNPEFGCMRCGRLAISLMVGDWASQKIASHAALESAQAVIVVKRYLDSLAVDDDDEVLKTIRQRIHAPLYEVLHAALEKMKGEV